MSDYTTLVERELRRIAPASYSLDDVARRRNRRRRNQRITSAIVALLLATLAIGGAIRAFEGGERQRPAAPPITPENVSSLHLIATDEPGGQRVGVTTADGLIF